MIGNPATNGVGSGDKWAAGRQFHAFLSVPHGEVVAPSRGMTIKSLVPFQTELPIEGVAPGLCQCGCGQPTRRAPQTSGGYIKGEWQRYIRSHGRQRRSRAMQLRAGRCRHGHDLRVCGVNAKGECRQCGRAATARWHARNPGAGIARGRRRVLAGYGLTQAEYDARALEQGGGCAICRVVPHGAGRRGTLHVDHNHATGFVRGLLCVDCNLILGKCHDAPTHLRACIAYLERTG